MAVDQWDVVHVGELGLSRATDSEILLKARETSRVCVTLDADFHAILAVAGESTPSVVRIRREGLDASALARLIAMVWPRVERDLMLGAVVTVTENSVRTRRLPIQRS
jgi:predicted nuclease of predicted toxin-antitoxin system